MIKRLATAALLTPLLLGALTACGNDDKPTTPAAASPNAASTPNDNAPTVALAQAKPGERVEPTSFTQAVQSAMQESKTFHVTTEMTHGPAQKSTFNGQVDLSNPNDPKMMFRSAKDGFTAFVVNKTLYIGGQMFQGKFAKIAPEQLQGLTGAPELTNILNPNQQLSALGQSISSVTYTGQETVGAVATKRYVVMIDPAKASAAPAGMPIGNEQIYWLDEKNRIITMEIKQSTQQLNTTITSTLSRFNEPVQISAPKPEQLTTLPGMPTANQQSGQQ